MRVLVVDDDRNVLATISAMIQAERPGWTVDCVGDSYEALKRLNDLPYDVILSDLHMPQLDGISLLKQVRAMLSFMPVVFLTGYKDRYAAAAWELGAFAVLDKPVEMDLLIQSLEAAVLQRAARTKVC